MSISREELAWVAKLARLELAEADFEKFAGQLGAIVDYMDRIRAIDTDDLDPLDHPMPISNVFRDDEPQPCLPVETALANAPAKKDNFFVVPAVLD